MQIGERDAENVAEKVGGEVGHEARCKVGKEDADAHAERPNHGDSAVGTHFAATTEPVDAETADEGESGGTDEWGETEKSAHAHTTQGGMCHAAAGDNQPTGDDITTHAGTEETTEQGAEEGVLEKGVGENGKHLEGVRRLMGKVGAALSDEEDDVVFEFVGEGDFAELQGANPTGDFFGAQGGEDFVELFDFLIAVLIGISSAKTIEFFVFVVFNVATHGGEQTVFFAGGVLSATTGGGTFANFRHFVETTGTNLALQPPLSDETGDGGDDTEDKKEKNEFGHERIGGFYGIIRERERKDSGQADDVRVMIGRNERCLRVICGLRYDFATNPLQVFPKSGIRLADDFRTADFDRTDNEGGGRKGERHAVVVVGLDGGNVCILLTLGRWMFGRELQRTVFRRMEHDAELPKFVLESGDAIGLLNMERCEAGEAKGATEKGASDNERLGKVGSRRKVAHKNAVHVRCAFREDGTFCCKGGFHAERREEFGAGSIALYTFGT